MAVTLCISNGWLSAINETNMNKTNGSTKMKVIAENPATAHTLVRYTQIKTKQMSTNRLIKIRR